PVVQDVEFVEEGQPGREQFAYGADYVRRLHVLPADILLIDEQDTVMRSPLCLPLGVQEPEVVRILGDKGSPTCCRVRQVHGVIDAPRAFGAWCTNGVPSPAQQDPQVI